MGLKGFLYTSSIFEPKLSLKSDQDGIERELTADSAVKSAWS